ncbi:protein UL13 [Mandrillus leucophaeus cytomegalovirus]|uniref:Protein UL13 n=1 Tax=Mandrillus leucophaeus cytomegalovirus TaxID=1654930 RepID=A0A0G2UM30_9BETA|nr:protein UL13 [Mandrillus leucophaeus cytomegalovirus]AKI29797.1 protein UL13 [Mandrillus leucophaeus cytomegalovirus]
MARHRCHKNWRLWLSVILGSWITLLNALEIVDECSEEQSIMQAAMRQMALRMAAMPINARRSAVNGRPPSIPQYLDVRSPRPPRHRYDEDPVSANIRWQHEQMQFLMQIQRARTHSRPWAPTPEPPSVRLPPQFARPTLGYGQTSRLPATLWQPAAPMAAAAAEEAPRVVIVRNKRPNNAGPGPRLPHHRRNAIVFSGSTDSLDLARLRLQHERHNRSSGYRWKHQSMRKPLRTVSMCVAPPPSSPTPPARPPISEPMEFRQPESPEPQRRRTLGERLRTTCRKAFHLRHKDPNRHRWHVRRRSSGGSISIDDFTIETRRSNFLGRTHSWLNTHMPGNRVWRLRNSNGRDNTLNTPLSADFPAVPAAPRLTANRSRPPSPTESVTIDLQSGEVIVLTSDGDGNADAERLLRNERAATTASRQLCSAESIETLNTCTGERPSRRHLLGTSLALWFSGHWARHHRKS